MKELLLSLDVGTQSVRALVFNASGDLLDKAQIMIDAYESANPGWAEHHPDFYWDRLGDACQKLWSQGLIKANDIAGLSLTTQRGTVVNIDAAGRPLRNAILWLDQRRTEGLKPVGGLWGLAFRIIRMRETIAYFQAEAEANWISAFEPDVWQKTHKYLLLSGYLSFKLTGKFVDSVGSQVAYIPFDYKSLSWAKSWDWKWQVLPTVKPSMMPELIAPTQALGELTSEAALKLGLPKGLTVIASAADKACEVIGSGALKPNLACVSYGTTATLNMTHERYFEAIPFLPPYPSAVPNHYSLESQVFRGYWMVSWFKEEFGLAEQQKAQELGMSAEVLFDDLVNQVPAGSDGLILQPYWSPGLKKPGPEAKGAVLGFNDQHTRAHLYRAMLEGIAYALREGAENMQQKTGTQITELRVAGGGSQSNAAMQLTADIFNLPASRPHVYEASGLGAAIDTAIGLGLHDSFHNAVEAMTRIKDTYEPNTQNALIYEELYQKLYKKMYKQLKPLYENLRELKKTQKN